MINIQAVYTTNGNKFVYNDYVDTIEDAIKADYRFWYHYKVALRLYYNDIELVRLNNDCSFDEEIEYLKDQIIKIDENEVERCKYEN
jgi:hypothetical protein